MHLSAWVRKTHLTGVNTLSCPDISAIWSQMTMSLMTMSHLPASDDLHMTGTYEFATQTLIFCGSVGIKMPLVLSYMHSYMYTVTATHVHMSLYTGICVKGSIVD